MKTQVKQSNSEIGEKEIVKEGAKTEGDLDSFVEWFIQSRKIIGCTEKTIKHYITVLSMFVKWHALFAPNCTVETCNHVEQFLASLQCKPISKETYLRALKTLFNFAIQQGLRTDNPAKKLKIKVGETIPKAVSEEHFVKVINALNLQTFTGLRNAVLFSLAYDTGARLSELLSLTVGDIIVGKRRVLIKGKGNKERWIFFGRTTEKLIQAYLIQYSRKFGISQNSPLFVTDDGRPIKSKDQVRKLWVRAQLKAGLKPLPFHGLRHGFAKHWITSGGDLFSLQQILGHTSLEVTKRYVKLMTEDLEKMHSQFSPVDRILFLTKSVKKH